MKRLNAELQRIDRARRELATERAGAERSVLEAGSVAGEELAALAGYLIYAKKEEGSLLLRRRDQEQRNAEQHRKLLEARRKLRLLEKHRARRLAEWRYGLNRELEEFAAEAYLTQWNARQAGGSGRE